MFPGGGYNVLAIDLEGSEVCDWLTSKGITCVLLKYRVPCVKGDRIAIVRPPYKTPSAQWGWSVRELRNGKSIPEKSVCLAFRRVGIWSPQ